MQIHVTFRHMDSSDALKTQVEAKLAKFQKFLHEPIEIHVVLQVQKIRQIAEVTVKAKNFHFHGIEESTDMYASIDLMVDLVDRQLKKHKEIVKEHKSAASTREVATTFGRLEKTPSE